MFPSGAESYNETELRVPSYPREWLPKDPESAANEYQIAEELLAPDLSPRWFRGSGAKSSKASDSMWTASSSPYLPRRPPDSEPAIILSSQLTADDHQSSGSSSGSFESAKGLFDFANREAMKLRVREALTKKPEYSVVDFYWETGFWRTIACHPIFENVTLVVIGINAIWMMIDADYNSSSTYLGAESMFQIADQFFCFYFVTEITIRFMALRRKLDGFKDAWFVFDLVLVVLMIVEIWLFTLFEYFTGISSPMGDAQVLRLLRLARLTRLLRMLRSLPELMVLIKGIVTAMKSVFYVLVLLTIVTYVFAIAMTQLSQGDEILGTFFSSVPLSMYFLFIHGTFLDDLAYFCDTILSSRPLGPFMVILVFIFICLACLTIMNMLVGVLCEVVSAVAAEEKETLLAQTVSTKLAAVFEKIDKNNNGVLSYEEFKIVAEMPESIQALTDVGVDPVILIDMVDVLFVVDGEPVELTFEELITAILELRGSNVATVKDIMNMWKKISTKLIQNNKEIKALRTRIIEVEAQVHEYSKGLTEQVDAVVKECKTLAERLACISNSNNKASL